MSTDNDNNSTNSTLNNSNNDAFNSFGKVSEEGSTRLLSMRKVLRHFYWMILRMKIHPFKV